MNSSDAVGIALFSSFGLWWAISPQSVIRFYTWFHRGKISRWSPKPAAVRIVGIQWVALIVWVAIFVVQR
jgi:hypothetical protein